MKKNHQPLVSVVLLSHNRPALLIDALASLRLQSYSNLEIIVVDNPSPTSDEVARIVSKHPGVQLIQNSTNVGFTGGMNKGLQAASGDYVCLTEDDIVLDRTCLQRLVEYSKADPAAGLVAPIMLNKTSGTIRCAGGDFAFSAVHHLTIHGAGECDTGQFQTPFAVSYIAGAAMFARRDFWQTFAGFRDEYFMYSDDLELCVRVNKAGHRMMIVPQARVYHFEPSERVGPPGIEFHRVKNFFSLYLLHAPARILPEFLCRYAIVGSVRSLLGGREVPAMTFFKALMWVAGRTPWLLRERYRQSHRAKSSHQEWLTTAQATRGAE